MINRKILANAIRFLSIDMIEKANSGHPGSPMGMADIAEVLWRDYLNHNPNNPTWLNRDRFILSNGHSSALLYSILHLTGYNISINDLKNFRQLGSKTPGHPEYNPSLSIESTTGPLGQGIANAVGFAIAEKVLGAKFNLANHTIIDHYTYVFIGDGCLMEGISHEVCSLAGTLKLGKLIVFYDNNNISIDGEIKNWFSDNTEERFNSYNWHVVNNINGHNYHQIKKAIDQAHSIIDKPSLLMCKTIIGYGSPDKAGTNSIHGTPLTKQDNINVRKRLKWKYLPFEIPKNIYQAWNACITGKKKEDLWNKQFSIYKKQFPRYAQELIRRINKKLPYNWRKMVNKYIHTLYNQSSINISTRQASQNTLEVYSKKLPELLGGSADLSPSNLTMLTNSKSINHNKYGNYIHYGAREFGMSAIINGISLYGGFIPYGGTFLIFSEYASNAIRMACLMKVHCIFIYTHDSIGIGEDGPTHQPIEQLAHLRMIPNMNTWRPCDQIETAIAWQYAIENKNGPYALILSRQTLQQHHHNNIKEIKNIYKGAYIFRENTINPKIILISTGSEIDITIKTYEKLIIQGYKIRVVSMPSPNTFDKQNTNYRNFILPPTINTRIAIEASISDFWYKYIGLTGAIIGIKTFGKSAPAHFLFKKYGFTEENIIKTILSVVKKNTTF
uniref:Transketolase n=1 Tax=Candidatus Aschnera chinzeii TaxID=1485666 RepID=A0AAT9G4W1_9ENTR|nr:MAG: transketolase [Candidatus Aschnera chinzeii]